MLKYVKPNYKYHSIAQSDLNYISVVVNIQNIKNFYVSAIHFPIPDQSDKLKRSMVVIMDIPEIQTAYRLKNHSVYVGRTPGSCYKVIELIVTSEDHYLDLTTSETNQVLEAADVEWVLSKDSYDDLSDQEKLFVEETVFNEIKASTENEEESDDQSEESENEESEEENEEEPSPNP